MECLPNDIILKFNSDTLEELRKQYGFENKKRIDDAIDILDEWIKKQTHFTKHDFERDYLERLLIANKGSVERAKERMDKMCTYRTLIPEFYEDIDIKNDFKDMIDFVKIGALHKLTKDHCRVGVIKTYAGPYSYDIVRKFYKMIVVLVEYLKMYDYNNGLIIISDLRDVNLGEIMPYVSLVDLRQLFSVIIEGYGTRLKSIHYITSSKTIELLLSLMKQVLPDKIAKRMSVHKTLDSLYETVSLKDIMPKDHGGEDKPFQEIAAEWVDILSSKEFREKRTVINKACTDEAAREKSKFNEEYLGIPGSFRALVVD